MVYVYHILSYLIEFRSACSFSFSDCFCHVLFQPPHPPRRGLRNYVCSTDTQPLIFLMCNFLIRKPGVLLVVFLLLLFILLLVIAIAIAIVIVIVIVLVIVGPRVMDSPLCVRARHEYCALDFARGIPLHNNKTSQ